MALKGAAVAGSLLVSVLVLCLDGVDYQPYFRTLYYTQTAERLSSAAPAIVQGELAAGFGRALLNPTLDAPVDDPAQGRFRMVPLAGFGSRKGRPATGVHDDLNVKAVALRSVAGQTGIVVSADALIFRAKFLMLRRRGCSKNWACAVNRSI